MSSTAEETFAGKPKIGSPVTVSLGDSMPDIGDELASVFEESYKAAGLTLAKSRTVGVVTPNAKANAEAYARARAGDAITDIDATTHDAVQRVIGNALRDSLSQQETADKLSGLFGDARAQTIARTEAQTAYNAGTISALKDAGEEYAVVNDPCECGEEVCDVDGEIWTLEECEAQLLGHPNCARNFRPLTEDELADVKEEEATDDAEGFAFLEARIALLEARQAFGDSFDEDKHPRDEKGRFTLVGDASKLGGATPKQFYRENATGAMHLFKPDPPVKILGAAAASQIARLVDPNAIAAEHVVINGKSGLMQQMVPGSKPMGAPVSAADFHAIQREQVIDWITSQHDSHPGQFIRDAQGNVRAVDKSQAWKYFGKDKLSQTYHPNSVYGERPPIYNTALKGSKLDPEVIRPILERASAITKAQSDAILRPYAAHVFGDGTPKYHSFLKAAHERIVGAKAAFSKYYSHLTGKSVKFSAEAGLRARAEAADTSDSWLEVTADASDETPQKFSVDFRALYYAHEQFDWDPDKHPREPAGSPEGGEFTSAGGSDEDMGSMIKTGEGNVGKSLSGQAKALLAKKEHQKELWKAQGARYRAKKKAEAEAKKLAALGIKPPTPPTGEKQALTPAGAKELLGSLKQDFGKTYGDQEIKGRIDKAIAAIDSKPEYAKNWVDLIEKHGIGAVGIGIMTSSNYEQFANLKGRIEAGTTHSLAPMKDGPTKGKIIEQQETLKTAVAMQSGMTPKDYLEGTRALRYYTESGYGDINRSLREGHGLDADGKRLDRFFAKLPDVEKDRMMYRAFEAPPDSAFAKALRAGHGEFTDPAFLSATTSHSFALEWKSNQPKQGTGDKWDKNSFVISWKNEGGLKNITPWGSLGTKEGEVMMRPGARIEILSSKWVPEGGGFNYGKWHCEVRVLPPDPTKDLPSASFKNASAKAQHAVPIGSYTPPKLGTPSSGKPEKKYYYEKKISPNTGKPYYVKKVKK